LEALDVDEGLRSKTIQGFEAGSRESILQWSMQTNSFRPTLPTAISLDVRSKQSEKKRSFTDEEAKVILRAALAEDDPVRRWVPWIGAYTGARVSEICQLRSEDVVKIDDIWCMKFAQRQVR